MERRQRGSSNPSEALTLFLSAVANRLGAESVVIADHDGLMVSCSQHADDAITLAALSSLRESERKIVKDRPVGAQFCAARVGEQTLHIAMHGSDAPIPQDEVQAGLRRILRAA